MLRVTMISTMPVAMIAIDVLCTDRFQRLREVMNLPSDMRWKPIQITASAATMPSRRVSISVAVTNSRRSRRVGVARCAQVAGAVSLIGVLVHRGRP